MWRQVKREGSGPTVLVIFAPPSPISCVGTRMVIDRALLNFCSAFCRHIVRRRDAGPNVLATRAAADNIIDVTSAAKFCAHDHASVNTHNPCTYHCIL
jgi:hypothetical protein